MNPVKIVRALIRANTTLAALLGSRVYPKGGVPDNAARPYAVLAREGFERDVDVDGTEDDRTADVRILAVGDTEAQADAVVALIDGGALSNKAGTYAGAAVLDTDVLDDSATDAGDEPIDLDEGEAFVASIVLQVRYQQP